MAEIAGLKLIVPSSVAGSGVSVSASGKVTFTAATTVNINGVFSSTYDNYLVVMRGLASTDLWVQYRLRASGSDATGSNYTYQTLQAVSSTVSGSRPATTTAGYIGVFASAQRSGFHFYIYGPALAQPTAFRGVNVNGSGDASLNDAASTHSLSTAYDGITFATLSAATMTGSLTVYGLSN
jgi:hypothetical protein